MNYLVIRSLEYLIKNLKELIKKKRDLNFSMQGDKDGLLDKIASHPFAFP